MTLTLVLALLLVGVAIALLARAAVVRQLRTSETIGRIGDYGYRRLAPSGEESAVLLGPLDLVAALIGAAVSGRVPLMREAGVRRELVAAGIYNVEPRRLMGYQILGGAAAAVVWLLAAGGSFSPPVFVVGLLIALAGGWYAPIALVRRRARERLTRIDEDLPELVDLLVVTVEAGLGLNASLKVASERLIGPLGDEIRLTLHEQSMGLATSEALRNLAARAETPAMGSFVRAIVQGEQLGTSIGQIMRVIADDMRKRRRSAAEERAQKAPIKLLFPLVFLIFPAMFVVLLGPPVLRFVEALG